MQDYVGQKFSPSQYTRMCLTLRPLDQIAKKILALQLCGWMCHRFPSGFCAAFCQTLELAPYLSSIYVQMYAVKKKQGCLLEM